MLFYGQCGFFTGARMTKNDFFNLSMTFRTDSDVPMPYGKFTKRDGTENPGDIFTEVKKDPFFPIIINI